ncbi:hypothetical protein ACLMJK_005830 [Lecanora helva]
MASKLDRTWRQSDGISFASNTEEPAETPFANVNLANKSFANDRLHLLSTTQVSSSSSSSAHLSSLSLSGPPNCSDSSAPPLAEQPFRSPLGFHIPKAKLQTAMHAAPSSPSAYWRYDLYEGPGGAFDKVKVHYCKNIEDTERVAKLFLNEEVIGFDIEWSTNASFKDGIKKNVALIQIASEQRVTLFHIARYPNAEIIDDFVAPSLKQLMESPEITKVGVSIRADCTRLRKHLDIHSHGLFELSHLYKLVKYSTGDVKKINKHLVSLADQVQEHLHLPLWKGEVRSSDWSQDLNYQQVQYAVSDTYAGFQLFHVLEAKRKTLDPTPPRPAHAELNLPIKLADGYTVAASDETIETTEDAVEYPDLSSEISVDGLTHDVENLMVRDSDSDSTTQPPSQSAQATSPKEKSTSLPDSPELTLAQDWVAQYKAVQPTTSAKPAELRAYALWHTQNLDVPTVAKLMRKPPLKNASVAGYVGRAVQSEGLPFRLERLADLEKYCGTYAMVGVNWLRLRKIGEAREGAARHG